MSKKFARACESFLFGSSIEGGRPAWEKGNKTPIEIQLITVSGAPIARHLSKFDNIPKHENGQDTTLNSKNKAPQSFRDLIHIIRIGRAVKL